ADAERFQTVARRVRRAAHRAQDFVEDDALLRPFVLDDERSVRAVRFDAQRLVADQHVDPFLAEARGDHPGNLRVFANQNARQHLDLRYLRAETREALRELAPDRAAAEHDEAARQRAQ